jgi:hypothetical protein
VIQEKKAFGRRRAALGDGVPLAAGAAISSAAALEGDQDRFPSAVAYDPAAEIPPPIPPAPPRSFASDRVVWHVIRD